MIVAIMVVITVTIVMMTPFPMLSLFVTIQVAEIAMLVAASFYGPLVVKNNFIVIPAVTIMVVRVIVVIAATMLCAGGREKRQCQCAGDQTGSY
jgi:hypothetical protein